MSLLLLGALLAQGADSKSIPRDLNEAHQSLAEYLSPAETMRIKKMRREEEVLDVIGMPQAIGLTTRWGLWANSPLARYFKGLGVTEPHDMIGIVASTYWCKLHGKPFGLKARIAKLRAHYAQEEAMKLKGGSPRDGAEIDWFYSKGSPPNTVYLGVSLSDASFWRYEHRNGRGIEPARPNEAKEMTKLLHSIMDMNR